MQVLGKIRILNDRINVAFPPHYLRCDCIFNGRPGAGTRNEKIDMLLLCNPYEILDVRLFAVPVGRVYPSHAVEFRDRIAESQRA